eukprot:c12624_g1_i4.p1 GENE.c12624_g1_i4~~c12624_g1_i4.p1  ORF type:complete len:650 (-),score=176.97 c12624_g1_i4:284-2233(-)
MLRHNSVMKKTEEHQVTRRNDSDLTQMTTGVGNLLVDPPREELKKVFDKWAGTTAPNGRLTLEDFIRVCADINIGLSDVEVTRMFTNMCDASADITFNQFVVGVKRWRLLSTIASSYTFTHEFHIPANYDYTKSTNECYGQPKDAGFREENKRERAAVDYSYHVNYTIERQEWQDMAIRSVVVRTQTQPRPWLVLTSGPPGAGKTYALSWMSQHGYFPLENIVRVDPDYFKRLMPEWEGYSKLDPETAASKCHKESAFFAEIAQMKAMYMNQNVWVDTTLKEYVWFGHKFDEYRKKFPQYRIAIFYITAPREKILQRVAERAQKTGRAVPNALVEYSLEGLPRALEFLTPKVDFVARVSNERDGAAPVLQAVQVVDSSGSWNIIRQNFAHTQPSPTDFPFSFAPIFVTRTAISPDHLLDNKPAPAPSTVLFADSKRRSLLFSISLQTLSSQLEELFALVGNRKQINAIQICTSPLHPVNLDSAGRLLANIPSEAFAFVFLYPCLTSHHIQTLANDPSAIERMRQDSVCQLLQFGGFAYFDAHNKLIAVNAVTVDNTVHMIQFGPPCDLPYKAAKALKKQNRWHPVTIEYLVRAGTIKFAWVLPGEQLAGQTLSRFGAFVFMFKQKRVVTNSKKETQAIYFPVASDSWDY